MRALLYGLSVGAVLGIALYWPRPELAAGETERLELVSCLGAAREPQEAETCRRVYRLALRAIRESQR